MKTIKSSFAEFAKEEHNSAIYKLEIANEVLSELWENGSSTERKAAALLMKSVQDAVKEILVDVGAEVF